MKHYNIQFAFNESTGVAGEHIGKVGVRAQAEMIASKYAKRTGRNVDIFEVDTEQNRVINRWIAFASTGGIWKN